MVRPGQASPAQRSFGQVSSGQRWSKARRKAGSKSKDGRHTAATFPRNVARLPSPHAEPGAWCLVPRQHHPPARRSINAAAAAPAAASASAAANDIPRVRGPRMFERVACSVCDARMLGILEVWSKPRISTWENEGGVMDRSKGNKRNWILVWEDGFCDFSACTAGREAKPGARYGAHSYHTDDSAEPTMHPELFFKMSHEVYNYGEGLMGKVAADNSHKWVYREPLEHEISFLSPWHGSLDPHPRTWEAQFKAGIQTVAVISVREGLVQLGSLKKVLTDQHLAKFPALR
ncbi:hypothetical protein AXG93_4010s1130 [Marchantia polymorpha subsp. ruderalis]|uniref:Transcription factor MYC/MYB N-terminal domain-containing protein n=1 Tax=Marchantia polymorpha subsp. ruderalis TaxID=1480154 RepID=A0A176VKI3_MARPO|nr:hypothetical protein AXG93_4010s1130 [Marchantia polymorpha subsp. ruderalis]